MKTIVPLDAIEATFRRQVEAFAAKHGNVGIDEALHLLRRFYQEYACEAMDASDDESDMLLAEYGEYDGLDGNGKQFHYAFTRQFLLQDDEEYQQLRLELCYNPDDFAGVAALTAWSADYPSLEAWQDVVIASAGFQQALQKTPTSFAVRLEMT